MNQDQIDELAQALYACFWSHSSFEHAGAATQANYRNGVRVVLERAGQLGDSERVDDLVGLVAAAEKERDEWRAQAVRPTDGTLWSALWKERDGDASYFAKCLEAVQMALCPSHVEGGGYDGAALAGAVRHLTKELHEHKARAGAAGAREAVMRHAGQIRDDRISAIEAALQAAEKERDDLKAHNAVLKSHNEGWQRQNELLKKANSEAADELALFRKERDEQKARAEMAEEAEEHLRRINDAVTDGACRLQDRCADIEKMLENACWLAHAVLNHVWEDYSFAPAMRQRATEVLDARKALDAAQPKDPDGWLKRSLDRLKDVKTSARVTAEDEGLYIPEPKDYTSGESGSAASAKGNQAESASSGADFGPSAQPVSSSLPCSAELLARLSRAKSVDIIIRKDSVERRFQADWLKDMARQQLKYSKAALSPDTQAIIAAMYEIALMHPLSRTLNQDGRYAGIDYARKLAERMGQR